MSQSNRPLSPHLQVYRLPLLALLSITHRATGVALGAGAVVLAAWLLALAAGPEPYATTATILGSLPGQGVLFLFTLALHYHLCNGIRHLFWDIGRGFEIDTAYATGKAVIMVSIVLTLLTWGLALSVGDGP